MAAGVRNDRKYRVVIRFNANDAVVTVVYNCVRDYGGHKCVGEKMKKKKNFQHPRAYGAACVNRDDEAPFSVLSRLYSRQYIIITAY